jgi:hypothetical protein
VATNVAGYAFDLYGWFWWFDRVLHGATLFALTFWLAVVVLGDVFREGNNALFVLLVASVGIAAGALWEVAEWAFDQFAPGDVIKGKDDTVLDIVMDTIGSVLAALLALRYRPSGVQVTRVARELDGASRVR